MRLLLWIFILSAGMFLYAADATQKRPQRQVQIPPVIHTADAAHQKIRLNAVASVNKVTQYPFAYASREVEVVLQPESVLELKLTDIITINRNKFALKIQGKTNEKMKKVCVILPDNRWFDCDPGSLPTLPKDSVVIIKNTFRSSASTLLPMAQIIFQIQKKQPVCSLSITLPKNLPARFYHIPVELYKSRKEVQGKLIFTTHKIIPPFFPTRWDAYPKTAPMRMVVTTARNWEQIRKWSNDMTASAAGLDDQCRELLAKLTAGAVSDTEKVQRIYNYLNSLRYLTIPVGETALRPQEPGRMIRNGYGDCKDKSNALVMFCRELGIPAEMVLVSSNGAVDTQFPSWQFNHMMVFIPKLTGFPSGLWLDPAGGTAVFGELPSGTLDTVGLVIDKQLRFRKVTVPDLNKISSGIRESVVISIDGKVVINGSCQGLFAQTFRRFLGNLQPHTRKDLALILDSKIPCADMVRFQGKVKDAAYQFIGTFPMPGFIPDLTIASEITTPFRSAYIARPVRLYDGHRLYYHRTVKIEGKVFQQTSWNIRRDRYTVELSAKGDTITYGFELKRKGDNAISPQLYKEIRAAINQLRIRVQNIKEQNM